MRLLSDGPDKDYTCRIHPVANGSRHRWEWSAWRVARTDKDVRYMLGKGSTRFRARAVRLAEAACRDDLEACMFAASKEARGKEKEWNPWL